MPNDVINPDAVEVDAMAIVLENYDCEVLDPELLGLTKEMAAQVVGAVRGKDCAPIRILPNPDCKQEIAPADSQFQFEGTVVFLKSGGYQLLDGKGVYQAVRDACGNLPNVEVSALGVQMKPTMDFKFYSRLERGSNGEILIRFHMFEGEGMVTFEQKGSYKMQKGLQILVDPKTFKVVEAKSFAEEPENPIPAQTGAHLAVPDGGCNTAFGHNHFPDGLTAVLLTAATIAAVSSKTRSSLRKSSNSPSKKQLKMV